MTWNSAWRGEDGWSAAAAAAKTNVPPTLLASGNLTSGTTSTTAASAETCNVGDVVVIWVLTGGSFTPNTMVVKDSGSNVLSVGTWSRTTPATDSGGVSITGFAILLTGTIPSGSTFSWTNSGSTGPFYIAEHHAAGIGPGITLGTGVVSGGSTSTSVTITDGSDTPPLYVSAGLALNSGSNVPSAPSGWTRLQSVANGGVSLCSYYKRYTATPADSFAPSWTVSSLSAVNYVAFASA